MTVVVTGIGVSSGSRTAIGRALLLSHGPVAIEPRLLVPGTVDDEIERFQNAVMSAAEQIRSIRARIPLDTPADILAFLDTHLLMLEDHAISEAPIEIIRHEGCSAEWALKIRRDALIRVFDEMEDPYLRTRRDDLDHVVNRILQVLAGNQHPADRDYTNQIVVAHDLTPADVVLLHHKGAIGLVSEYGGPMSHTAILARSLGMPAVVGAHGASACFRSGETLVLDAENGVVLAECDSTEIAFFEDRLLAEQDKHRSLRRLISATPRTKDGRRLQLLANIELPEDSRGAVENGADGIGLYRTEFLYMNRTAPPTEEEHYQAYLQVLQTMDGKPVTIRTLDLGADKPSGHGSDGQICANPALGLRAIRLCLKETDIFRTQIRALLRASAEGDLRVMIPMLTNLREAVKAREIIDEEAEQLQQKGVRINPWLPVGAMIETPAAALMAQSFARIFDFLSIGTNDLIQYTLAVDRADDTVNHLYDPLHPAVLQLISQTITAGRILSKPVAMCGEMAGDPRFLPLLIGMGLEQFSMHPGVLLDAKQVILGLDAGSLEQCVDRLLQRLAAGEADIHAELAELSL